MIENCKDNRNFQKIGLYINTTNLNGFERIIKVSINYGLERKKHQFAKYGIILKGIDYQRIDPVIIIRRYNNIAV
jgi:isocitrate dehydrogenase